MELASKTKNPNPNPDTITTKNKSNTNLKNNNNFEFCKVCKLNHNQGRRHNFFPNHIKSLSSFLSRFDSKISDVRLFIKNPSLIHSEIDYNYGFWCVFCDCDVTEHDSFFARENAISHLASSAHLKNLKNFLWKYGGGMDRVDRFRVSETDLAKYEKKCVSMKSDSELSRGPSNDIHNDLTYDLDNFDKSRIDTYNSSFSNGVLPLQNHTNEKYQVSNSDQSGNAAATSISSYDNKSLLLSSDAKRSNNLRGNAGSSCLIENYHNNGLVYTENREATGEGSSAGLQKLTQISFKAHETDAGNVHSGAPPPWLDATNGIHLNRAIKTIKSKLNPKRVGAAWAEKRKIEMELEKRGELPANQFDANWLPNFGRVWQSGTRKDSRKEFEVEVKKPLEDEKKSDSSLQLQLQPYVSKRMRREANG